MSGKIIPKYKIQLPAVLLVYLFMAAIFGFTYRYSINADAVSYMRLAGYIAEGNYQQSVTGYWAPLITWIMAPFLFFGLDGLTASRIVVALSGFGLIISTWLLTGRFHISEASRFLTMLIAVLLFSYWPVHDPGTSIGPDLLVTAFLVLYFYFVTGPDILRSKRGAFLCGAVAGLAYLAKHYALPFFIIHFPLTLILAVYFEKGRKDVLIKKVFSTFFSGLIGFLIISLPWIFLISSKYQYPTFATSGGINHAMVGPEDKDRRHPSFYGGLHKPGNSYAVHSWEDPSEIEYKRWSPLESKAYFMHQLRLMKGNVIIVLNYLVFKSPFFTYPFVIAILSLIPVVLLLTPLSDKKRFLYFWVVFTLLIYSSGYILTYARSARYYYPVMVIVFLMSIHFLEELKRGLEEIKNIGTNGRRKKVLFFCITMIFVSAFIIKPGQDLLRSVNIIASLTQVNVYKGIADKFSKTDFPGPYAVIRSSQKPDTDLFMAFYLKKQFLGRPVSTNVDEFTRELKEVNAKSLIIFGNKPVVRELKNDMRYKHMHVLKINDKQIYDNGVYHENEGLMSLDREVNIFSIN
jgi:hypothetical protein